MNGQYASVYLFLVQLFLCTTSSIPGGSPLCLRCCLDWNWRRKCSYYHSNQLRNKHMKQIFWDQLLHINRALLYHGNTVSYLAARKAISLQKLKMSFRISSLSSLRAEPVAQWDDGALDVRPYCLPLQWVTGHHSQLTQHLQQAVLVKEYRHTRNVLKQLDNR